MYNFADLQLLAQLETYTNPKGLCALAPSVEQTVLALPGALVLSVWYCCVVLLSTSLLVMP